MGTSDRITFDEYRIALPFFRLPGNNVGDARLDNS